MIAPDDREPDAVAPSGEPIGRAEPIGEAESEQLFAPLCEFSSLALAVSGGPDSMALMGLLSRWRSRAPATRPRVSVLTVDHGLRAQSAAEAEFVKRAAESIGLQHATLVWTGPKASSGIQDAARRARYRLLEDHVASQPDRPAAIVLAHHQDDQAETVLMRLARGSALDGLAGMSPLRPVIRLDGVFLARPLLGVPKERLAASLGPLNLRALTDPSNENLEFERVRIRAARAMLEELGLTNAMLALSASRLRRARRAIERSTKQLDDAAVDWHAGAYATIDCAAFNAAPAEIRVRLLARIIERMGGLSEPAEVHRFVTLG